MNDLEGKTTIFSMHFVSIFITYYLSVTHGFFNHSKQLSIKAFLWILHTFNVGQNEGQTDFLI